MIFPPGLIQKDALKPLLQGQDQLIVVLDACRYDIFLEVNWLSGYLEPAISGGSTTTEWATNTFTDFYPNVVYISSVPYVAAKIVTEAQNKFLGLQHFAAVDDVWDWGYDEELETVKPETVVDATIRARKAYPGKTLIAHFMQPHCPYIGIPPFSRTRWEQITGERFEGFPHIESIFDKGQGDLLKEAYKGNLVRVIKAIEKFDFYHITITADHGEGFGESGVYDHRDGIRTPELLSVPWFTLET